MRIMEPAFHKEEELIQASQQGSETAFRELMLTYIGAIYNFAKQYGKTEADAEDITQDTFFKAWKHLKRFDAKKSFKPWLYAIARNTALDHIKRKRTSTFSELDSGDSELQFADSLEDNSPLPDQEYEKKEIAREITGALNTLSPDHRAVLIMHYHEDLTFNEIADIMKKPMNTVKSWHRRALAKIKKLLVHRKP